MTVSFSFKEFLTFEEVGHYLATNGYPYDDQLEDDYYRLKTTILDLYNEGQLRILFNYAGWVTVKVWSVDDSLIAKDLYELHVNISGYFYVNNEFVKPMLSSNNCFELKGDYYNHFKIIGMEDLPVADLGYKTKVGKEHTSVILGDENDAIEISFTDLRYPKIDLDKLFKLDVMPTSIEMENKNISLINLGEYQKLLVTYDLFTPEEIACLLTDSNPSYAHNNDDYNARLNMVSNAVDSSKLNYITDKDQISAQQVKLWLKNSNLVYEGFNDNLSLEQSTQVTELQKRIDELERELNYFKESSNIFEEVITVDFTDEEYRDIVDFANQDGVSVNEFVSNAAMKSIERIKPFIKAFDLNNEEELSKARSKLLKYLQENENSYDIFSMLADAEIFPHEYSQFSTNQESNIKDSAYFLIAVMKDLLLNVEITGYYFQSDSDNGKKSPTQAALTEHIVNPQ